MRGTPELFASLSPHYWMMMDAPLRPLQPLVTFYGIQDVV